MATHLPDTRQLKLLREVLALGTAPFREHHVSAYAEGFLSRYGIPYFLDPIGNIVVGVASATEYRTLLRAVDSEPVRVFIAHMDHPGFHGVEWRGKRTLLVKWHGGSPVLHVRGTKVWLEDDAGNCGTGTVQRVRMHVSGHALGEADIRIDVGAFMRMAVEPTRVYGGFAFSKPVRQLGHRIFARAIDDLANVYVILETARRYFHRPGARIAARSFIGLLTRAEEVGFVGAIGHLELGWLGRARRDVLCISLEASRTLPKAVIGGGPVVRLGDRRTVFDSAALQVLTEMAEKLLPGCHQRRIMDGGSCEATAATAFGLTTIGLSIPLGNYHNEGHEGGPDCPKQRGPAPEFAHLGDIAGQTRLCWGLLQKGLPWTDAWSQVRARLRKNFRAYRRLL